MAALDFFKLIKSFLKKCSRRGGGPVRLGLRLRPSNKKVVRQNFQKFQARGSLKQNLKNRKIENQGAGKNISVDEFL